MRCFCRMRPLKRRRRAAVETGKNSFGTGLMIMHNSIQQSILLSLILILAAHMLFSPVALSVIFALMLLLLYLHYKKKTARISKVWTYGLTCCALASIYLSYKSLIGVEAGVAIIKHLFVCQSFRKSYSARPDYFI